MGEAHGAYNTQRIWNSYSSDSENVAGVRITPKTHKPLQPNGLPKTRIIVNGGECSTAYVGDLLADLLESCISAYGWGGECVSTQHMLLRIKEASTKMSV